MSDTITITGNIATEPTEHKTATGIAVTRFRVASGQRRFDKDTGQWVEGTTNWYSVSAYRQLADHAFASLRKGERILVTGRLRLRAWEKDGRQGTEAEIDADALGHDLRFGTTTFQRTSQRSADGGQAPSEPADQPAVLQEWATPGEPRDEDVPEEDAAAERELVESPF